MLKVILTFRDKKKLKTKNHHSSQEVYFTQVVGSESEPCILSVACCTNRFFFPDAGFHGNASVTNLNKCG